MNQWIPAFGLVALAISCVVPPIRLARRLRRYVASYDTTIADPTTLPRAIVVLPCKGLAHELRDLEDNLRGLLTQDYPAYRVVFAVGDPEDLALPILRKLCDEYEHASLVIAEHRTGQSQKVSNQLRALEEIHHDDEVIAFFDSDARPAADHLAQLIAPLRDSAIGATTGFRWYTPIAGGFASWWRAAWNASGMPIMIEDKYNYVWGGAMAIRRDVFEETGVAEYWSSALSDDLGMSLVVKQAGYRIVLVPQVLVKSPEDASLLQAIEWSSRQTVVCRVYNPVMWRDIFIGELITFCTLLAGFTFTVIGTLNNAWAYLLAGLITILLITGGRTLFQAIIVRVAKQLSPSLITPTSARRLTLLGPLVNPLILYNSLRSWISQKITWRGIRYNLKGPQDIAILNQ